MFAAQNFSRVWYSIHRFWDSIIPIMIPLSDCNEQLVRIAGTLTQIRESSDQVGLFHRHRQNKHSRAYVRVYKSELSEKDVQGKGFGVCVRMQEKEGKKHFSQTRIIPIEIWLISHIRYKLFEILPHVLPSCSSVYLFVWKEGRTAERFYFSAHVYLGLHITIVCLDFLDFPFLTQ